MTQNVYIHIPFCKSKCNYCSFVSFTKLELKERYLVALRAQIRAEYKGENLKTLYFGGGTPSLLTIEEIESILKLFKFDSNAEITVEVNPDSVDFEFLQGLFKLGVNRLSIGSQTFDDEILKTIGRRHNSEQIITAVKMAKKAGFDNISLDLIYGLPNQNLSGFEKDLNAAISLGIQHVSLYGLKIDDGCYFHKNLPKNLPDLDLQADMYLSAVKLLKNNGFEHYEISNFSLPNFNSRHNLNYWENNTYYGFGCAASGYVDGVRYTNNPNIDEYISNPVSEISQQKLAEQEILEEAIFLGLRKISGINIGEINQKFGIDFNQKYSSLLNKYAEFFSETPNGYALTLDGLLISNEILAEFIAD